MLNTTKLKALSIMLLTGGLLVLSTPSFAADSFMNLLRILRDRGSISQDEFNALANASQTEEADAQKAATQAAPTPGWWNDTKVSGRMYYNLSNIDDHRSGVRQTDSGWAFDIKRFYIGIDHKFSDMFSGNITTDFSYDSGPVAATQLYIKKAYLDAKINDMLDVRLGSTDLPWVPFVEGVYGYRYLEQVLVDRTKFGTSADWGIHASGKLGGPFQYALALVNGAGYKHPGVHSDTVDFEGRLSANWNDFIVAVGGYVGKLGKDLQGATTPHTANRFNVLGAYKTSQITVGVEYMYADNWTSITSVAADTAEGAGVFASYQFNPQWSVFGKYEYMEPNQKTKPALSDDYYNIGVNYSPAKVVNLSLVYKHDEAGLGSLSTGNGTIGGLTSITSGDYDEVGLFGEFRW